MAYTAEWTNDSPQCRLVVDNISCSNRTTTSVDVSFTIKGYLKYAKFNSPNYGGTAYVGNWSQTWIDPNTYYNYYYSDWTQIWSASGTTTVTGLNASSTSASISFGSRCSNSGWTSLNFSGTINLSFSASSIAVSSISVSPTSMELYTNGTKSKSITVSFNPTNATNKSITWSTGNSSVATVNNGTVTAAGNGSTTITAKSNNGKTASCSVTVKTLVTGVTLDKSSVSLLTNITGSTSTKLNATVYPTNASNKSVSWSSSNNSVATVDSNGNVTAKANGEATITVTTADQSKTASCKVYVSTPVTGVSLNITSYSLTTNGTNTSFTLTPTVSPSNATNKSVSWSSSNSNIASVNNGVVTAQGNGEATITVKTDDGGFTATCKVTVTTRVTGVQLNYYSYNLPIGSSFTLTPTVVPSNATVKSVTWSTGNGSKATVNNGTVSGIAAGQTSITVKTDDGGFTATCSLVVFNNIGPQGSYSPATYHNDNYNWVDENIKYGFLINGTFINTVNVTSTPIYKIEVDGKKVWFKTESRSNSINGNSLTRNGSYTGNYSGGCATFDHCQTFFSTNRSAPICPKKLNINVSIKFFSNVNATCYVKLFGLNSSEGNWCEIPISNNSISISNSNTANSNMTINLNTNNFYSNFKIGIFTPQGNGYFVESCYGSNPSFTSYDVDRSLE